MKNNYLKDSQGEILIYETADGKAKIEVSFLNDTVWLTQDQLATLFEKGRSTITEHINNIFREGELIEKSVCREFRRTASDKKNYKTNYYNLDVIISVGYRVKSIKGTQFRIWATQRLREYIVKGFSIDDTRLKQGGSASRYFEELLQRIRDIRTSERNFYQKITDIYATSIDYKADKKLTKDFFATVQNKMHFAIHEQTASEVIFNRADSSKPLMGLTGFKGEYLTQSDTHIAKNYLKESELKQLNLIVSLYLDFAELQATNYIPMKMSDWITKMDGFLSNAGKPILKSKGEISHKKAILKAEMEFQKFSKLKSQKHFSDFDTFINTLSTKNNKFICK